jgi:hypothetical protein
MWMIDLATLYLVLGALMRLSIADIGLRSEQRFVERTTVMSETFQEEGIQRAQKGTAREMKLFYILWPWRLWVDLRERIFWHLTPLRLGIYLIAVAIVFGILKWRYAAS